MRNNALRIIAVAGLALLVAACSNGYQEFYEPSKINYGPMLLPFSGEPQVLTGSKDAESDVSRMYADGYALIGQSSFTGPAATPAQAAQQAKAVGASHVLLVTEYERTVSGVLPMTTPTTQTSYTSGTVNAYGSGGSGWGNYSGTTTTYGTQTTYVPYNVDRYSHGALFFAPLSRTGLGIFRREGNDQEKQRAGTNKVSTVLAVRRGSPAYNADVLPGDLLISVDDVSFDDYPALSRYLSAYPGREMRLVLVRGTQKVEKRLVNPTGGW